MLHELSEPTTLMRAMGRILRRSRAARGWSHLALGRKAGVCKRTVIRYEQGWVYDVPKAERMALACGVQLYQALLEDAAMPGRAL